MGQCKICGKVIADDQDICEACQSDLDNVEVDVSDLGDFDLSLEDFDLPELSGDLLETDLEFNLEDPNNNLENPNIVVRDPEPDAAEDLDAELPEFDVEEPEAESVLAQQEAEIESGPGLEEQKEVEPEVVLEQSEENADLVNEEVAGVPDGIIEDSIADLSDLDIDFDNDMVPGDLPEAESEPVADFGLDIDADLPNLDDTMEEDNGLDSLLSETDSSSGMDLSGLLPEDLMAEINGEQEPEDHIANLLEEPAADVSDSSNNFLGDFDLGFDSASSDEDIALLDDLPDAEEVAELATPKPKISIWKRLFGNLKDEKWEKQKEKEAKAEAARLAKEEAKKAEEAEAASAGEGEGGENGEAAVDPKEAKKAAKLAKKEEKEKRKAEKKAEKERLKELAEEEDDDEGRINRVGAAIVFAFFGIVAAFVIAGTDIFHYNNSITKAESYFKEDEYTAAYSQLAGLDIKSKDQELYDKVRMVMYVNKELNSYRNYTSIRMYPEALDSLIKGLEKYDAHIENAEELDVTEDYNKLRNKILSEMESEYNLTEKEAYKLMEMEDQTAYSDKVIAIANE